ncbi:hypothetical protein D3OALGA1CA_2859 [Olavius algarvensis associated proteobacterium Delta 3]|nr:hypothetical protein D3OALGA1CA_2859 [Olavius algarvensis associated proteobacterium Delta 3]CAB5163211.1 hypothetical protein D3OALGB2SA_5565 [Olavius algarvensis associated proteobacterium Delta 3]
MPIYNCHIHTFTADHVPSGYLPFGLVALLKYKLIRKIVFFILRVANPFEDRDQLHRYANILQTSYGQRQEKIFKQVRAYYPLDTKFVVLPMDFAFMSAGAIETDIYQQHDELASLRDNNSGQVIPFVAVDPRREEVLEMLKDLVENKNYRGIKIYPPLGYPPDHRVLYDVYKYAQRKHLPIMAHCSRGGARSRAISRQTAYAYTDPDRYKGLMKTFPNLRFCMAHFGGDAEWENYLENPRAEATTGKEKNWVSKIMDMMRSGEYPHLYADISYTIFRFEKKVKVLKVLLSDERIRSQVLFGSDFYMVEIEKLHEKRLSIYLRAELGEELFWQIAEENPKRYLGRS